MSDEITSQGPEGSGINRRTVMKGAAWSVPVVLVASAAPAIASSRPIEISGVASSCKHPGGSGSFEKAYHIKFTFKNTSNEPITFTLPGLVPTTQGDVTSNPAFLGPPVTAGNPIVITIPALTSAKEWVVHYYKDNSPSLVMNMTYSYAGATLSGTITDSFTVNGDSCNGSPYNGFPEFDKDHACSSASVPACSPTP